jgi:hypothetical protein
MPGIINYNLPSLGKLVNEGPNHIGESLEE